MRAALLNAFFAAFADQTNGHCLDSLRSITPRTTSQQSVLRNTPIPLVSAPLRQKNVNRLARETRSLKTSGEHIPPGEGFYVRAKRFVASELICVMTVLIVTAAGVTASVTATEPYMKGATGTGISQNANLAKFSVSVDGAIPTTPDAFIQGNIAVGYAWADVSTGKALVAVIHPSFVDSRQQPSGWHVHTVTLGGGATSPNDFCVASVDSAPTAGIDVSGNTLTLNIRQSNLPSGETPGTLSTVVSFTLQSDAGCASGLAVQINT